VRAFCGNGLHLEDSAMTPHAHLPCNTQRAADMRPPTLRLYAPPSRLQHTFHYPWIFEG